LLFHAAWSPTGLGDSADILGRLPAHLADPRQAWPADAQPDLPGPAGFYTSAVLLLILAAAGATAGARRLRDRRQRRGFASPRQVRDAFGTKTVLKDNARLRPGVAKCAVGDVAVDLGTVFGRRLWLPIATSVLLLAAPRQGKTSQGCGPGPAPRWSPPCAVMSSSTP
jgi:hypothetical protein